MKKYILMQVHIPDWDRQGNLNFEEKLQLVEFVLEYTKHHNPDANIYLSGHGNRPSRNIINKTCTDIYWENECRQLNNLGFVEGMPAQYPFVSRGLNLVKASYDDYVLRTRGDGIIGRHDICEFCDSKLNGKRFIITQQTGLVPYKIGDFFHYAKRGDLAKLWNEYNPNLCPGDGLVHIGKTFLNIFAPNAKMPEEWHKTLKELCTFIDLYTLKFMDLRWNYHRVCVKYGWDNFKERVLNDDFDFREILWGNFEQWPPTQRLVFSPEGEFIQTHPDINYQFFSEKTFYQE